METQAIFRDTVYTPDLSPLLLSRWSMAGPQPFVLLEDVDGDF
jgi:hypothetical protein